MKLVKPVLLLTVLIPLNVAAVELYTFTNPCNLVLVNTATGISTDLGSLPNPNPDPEINGWSVEAMDYGPDGLLYATVEEGCWTHGNANLLATIDPATLTVNPIGPIDAGAIGIGDVDALAFSPTGELYAVSVASYQLITIDPFTGAGAPVGFLADLPGTFLGAIDFLLDGRLIGIDMLFADGGPSLVWEINPTDASAALIGPLGFNSVEGMTLGPNGEIFALANAMEVELDAKLVTANPINGAGTFIQEVGIGRDGQWDALVAIPGIEVTIDIKPGSWPNSINLRNQGVIPVAILSSDVFDATTVDPKTALFGPGSAAAIHDATHYDDVNLDGILDLVMHFVTANTGIACGDISANLFADTHTGISISGTDFVRTVACH